MVAIKKASKDDVEILALLGRITYSESHGHFINNQEDLITYNNEAFSIDKTSEELQNANIVYWMAYVDKLPVGYAKLILNTDNSQVVSKKQCRLERIYVLREFLGQKIGYELYKTVFEEAKSLGFEILWLTTYIKNESAIQFYERLGFNKVGSYDFIVNGKTFENVVFSKKTAN